VPFLNDIKALKRVKGPFHPFVKWLPFGGYLHVSLSTVCRGFHYKIDLTLINKD